MPDTSSNLHLLSNRQWELIKEFILDQRKSPKGPRFSPDLERFILDCILWKNLSGVPWDDLPDAYLEWVNPAVPTEGEPPPDQGPHSTQSPSSNDFGFRIPSHQTIYRRKRKWKKAGVFRKIIGALLVDLKTRLGYDLIKEVNLDGIKFLKTSKGRAKRIPGSGYQLVGARHKIMVKSAIPGSWQKRTVLLILALVAAEKDIILE